MLLCSVHFILHFAAVMLVVVLAAIVFPVIYVLDNDPIIEGTLAGVAFFVANTGSLLIYFSPKLYLVLTGATLNSKFQIVRKGQHKGQTAAPSSNDGGRGGGAAVTAVHAGSSTTCDSNVSSRVTENSLLRKYMKAIPTETSELHELMELLRGCVANMDLRGDLSSTFSSSTAAGNSHGGGIRAISIPVSDAPHRTSFSHAVDQEKSDLRIVSKPLVSVSEAMGSSTSSLRINGVSSGSLKVAAAAAALADDAMAMEEGSISSKSGDKNTLVANCSI
jgi:hypothetical protein